MRGNWLVILIFLAGLMTWARPVAADEIDLAPLRTLAVQNNQTMKTLDTLARQVIWQMTGHSSIDGKAPLYSLLDMTFRPGQYVDRNLIKIRNVPLRMEFQKLQGIDAAEKDRILRQGTVSLTFLLHGDVQTLLADAQAKSMVKAKAVNELMGQCFEMQVVCLSGGTIPAAMIAPANANDSAWHEPAEFLPPTDDAMAAAPMVANQFHDLVDRYKDRSSLMERISSAQTTLREAWIAGDAVKINGAIASLAHDLPQVNPAAYPSHAKRMTEVIYNRLAKATIPGAAFYLAAMVLFLMSWRAGSGSIRWWALWIMGAGLLIHTAGIAVRWWLVGDVFPPIKNEFESVMFSAWFGAVIGLLLEKWRARGIFGAAACFVGALALVAIFTVPFVADQEIGGEIGQVRGILMSYWLYIHVTMVTAAYALIAMGFMLSTWWLIQYYLARASAGKLRPEYAMSAADSGRAQPAGSNAGFDLNDLSLGDDRGQFLALLDQCNLVVLQLAFWVLGTGIVLGAIWADQSWGRPWGWDPKETFALITWIVYLIVVHVRVATPDKAWWTSVLSVIGFFVMLFNWVGVNFFKVGLHSYA